MKKASGDSLTTFNWWYKVPLFWFWFDFFLEARQRYTYIVLQTIQMKLILLCVWAEPAVLGSTKTTSKFKYEI